MNARRALCRAGGVARLYNSTGLPLTSRLQPLNYPASPNHIARAYYASVPLSSPAQPSRLRRAAKFIATAVLFTGLGFAMTVAPLVSDLNGILTPPTDEETLTMFTPEDPKAIEVEEYINSHWLAKELRTKPALTELRPHLKIPAPFRPNSLTAGVLMGPTTVPVPPVAWVEDGGKSLVSIAYLGPDLCGHPGIVHGGFLATMLDEGMARCSFGVLPHNVGMTANLNINYRAPCRTGTYVVLRAETVKAEGRKAEVVGRIETLPEKEGEAPTVLAEATGLFVSPKQAAMLRNVFPIQ